MEIGLGLDTTLGLSFDEERQIAREAAELGYTSMWTPEGAGYDSFQLCAMRWSASRDAIPGGLTTGIGVCPIAHRTPVAFAMSAGTLSALTEGRFVLGIGSGGIYRADTRRMLGLPLRSTLGVMRDYLTTVRGLLSGETVEYQGESISLAGMKLGIRPPETPVYLGALGPRMLELGGELADGIVLNWCSPEQIAWSRERVDAGAARAGREVRSVRMAEYIRICVDDDIAAARSAYARSALGYSLGMTVPSERERAFGYRAHFERMGHADELGRLDDLRRDGAGIDALVEAVSDEFLLATGYFGTADGAPEAFARLSRGLDLPIVRIVGAQQGMDAARAVMRACAPSG